MRVVPFYGGGRDLALQHESWKVVTIETNILRGYIIYIVVFYDYVCIEIYTHYNLMLLTSHNGNATP